jgi:hypothetical protein
MKFCVEIYDLTYGVEAKTQDAAVRSAMAKYHCNVDRLTCKPTSAMGRDWQSDSGEIGIEKRSP